MRPTFAYPGGKARLAPRIVSMLPTSGHRFVDVFAGRGNVTWAAMLALNYDHWWLNEAGDAFQFLVGLKHSDRWAIPDHNRATMERTRDRYFRRLGVIHPAPLLAPYLTFSGGGYRRRNGFRVPGGGVSRQGFEARVRLAAKLIRDRDVRFTRWDYGKVLAECGPGDVVYLDPPYLGSDVRPYGDATVDNREIVDILLDAEFRWVLSEYEHEIYAPLTKKFGKPQRIRLQNLASNQHRGNHRHAVECLWTNMEWRKQPNMGKRKQEGGQVVHLATLTPKQDALLDRFEALAADVDTEVADLLTVAKRVKKLFLKKERGDEIRGCTTFADYARKHFPKSARTIQRMLAEEGLTDQRFTRKTKPSLAAPSAKPTLPPAKCPIENEREELFLRQDVDRYWQETYYVLRDRDKTEIFRYVAASGHKLTRNFHQASRYEQIDPEYELETTLEWVKVEATFKMTACRRPKWCSRENRESKP